mmetsp:Transcript_78714/g.218681  ORF Transcript_78714/g.218681 Transcript_78714/m.218681 type:complete len:245 (-) Transcript_78714:1119-1853(-)
MVIGASFPPSSVEGAGWAAVEACAAAALRASSAALRSSAAAFRSSSARCFASSAARRASSAFRVISAASFVAAFFIAAAARRCSTANLRSSSARRRSSIVFCAASYPFFHAGVAIRASSAGFGAGVSMVSPPVDGAFLGFPLEAPLELCSESSCFTSAKAGLSGAASVSSSGSTFAAGAAQDARMADPGFTKPLASCSSSSLSKSSQSSSIAASTLFLAPGPTASLPGNASTALGSSCTRRPPR